VNTSEKKYQIQNRHRTHKSHLVIT